MKRKFYLIGGLALAMIVSGGTFAYTWTTASGLIGAEPCEGDIAICEPVANQPDWESVLPDGGDGGTVTETLRPNAAGDVTNIASQYPGGCHSGYHWDKVDDVTADDWATYVYHPGPDYGKDLYNLPAPSGSGTINGITVYFRFSGDSLLLVDKIGYAKALIKTHGVVYEGSEESRTGKTFVTKSYAWTTNPSTSSAWTWDEIDNLQIGLELKGNLSADYAYCTQVYCEVDYEAAPSAPEISGEVPIGDLFDVTCNQCYNGDVKVHVYLTNTAALTKAYQYLNIKLYLEGSTEAGQTPNYQLLTLDNGAATFNLPGGGGVSHTLSVIGGSYCLTSGDSSEWAAGWSVTPELYCEATQR